MHLHLLLLTYGPQGLGVYDPDAKKRLFELDDRTTRDSRTPGEKYNQWRAPFCTPGHKYQSECRYLRQMLRYRYSDRCAVIASHNMIERC